MSPSQGEARLVFRSRNCCSRSNGTEDNASIDPGNHDDGRALKPLLDALPVGYLSVDREDKIRQWSKGAATIFGWDGAEVMGQPIQNLVDWNRQEPGDPPSVQQQEVEATRKSGEPVELKLLHLNEASEETLVVASDITEQKFLERALLEATEREQRRIGQELHDHLCHICSVPHSRPKLSLVHWSGTAPSIPVPCMIWPASSMTR